MTQTPLSMKHVPLFVSLTAALLLSACDQNPTKEDEGTQTEVSQPKQGSASVEQLLQQGEIEAAIDALLARASSQTGANKQKDELQALGLMLDQDLWDRASALYEQGADDLLDSDQLVQRHLLGARIAAHQEDWDTVLDILDFDLPIQTRPEQRRAFFTQRAEAYTGKGDIFDSAQQRLHLNQYELAGEARDLNQKAMLMDLRQLPTDILERAISMQPGDLSPWLELALLIKRYPQDPGRFNHDVKDWHARYPSLAVTDTLLTELTQQLKQDYLMPARIAVLLPQAGPYANAANTIRDGLISAWQADSLSQRPEIRFYDSSIPGNTWALYQQAISDGAEFVVGPLNKQAVNVLAGSGTLDIPVLALNRSNGPAVLPENLFQFGLPPEDEAVSAAHRAWQDGHRYALILVPDSSLGQRQAQAFTQTWEQLGGTVLETTTYPRSTNDFGKPVRAMLQVENSKARKAALRRLLNVPLEFETRRRQDAEFIFLSAPAKSARIIRPQLKFDQAGDLPIYATSSTYEINSSADQNRDMDGIQFGAMPWLLDDGRSENDPLAFADYAELWPQHSARLIHLYAMGLDAYQIIPHLKHIQTGQDAFQGRVGRLTLDELGRLHRDLFWAEYVRGQTKALGHTVPIGEQDDLFEVLAQDEQ